MDFLPQPSELALSLPRVPYVAHTVYDAGDFFKYPSRAGWPQALPDEHRVRFWAHEMHHPSNDRDLEGFLQNWLFFGVLHYLLDPHSLYMAADLIDCDGREHFLTTEILPRRFETWLRLVRAWPQDRKKDEMKRVLSCLKAAAVPMQVLGLDSHLGFSREIRSFLAAFIEFVHQVALKIIPELDYPNHAIPLDLNSTELGKMRDNGWCPSEIMYSHSAFLNTASRLFMLQMRKPLLEDHNACTDDTCHAIQIVLEKYRPRHVEATCHCSESGPDPKQINECLEAGSFPLLKIFRHNGGVNIEAVPFTNSLGYVAISHVWADGLGNPARLKLPQCQVVRLQKLISRIRGRTFQDQDNDGNKIEWTETQDLYLWCDSLCTPVNPPGSDPEATDMKNLGLSKLQQIYRKASYVLVLDRSLECFSFASMGVIEAAMRIHTSRWVRRLWTFQEAGLAKTLMIHFADAIVDFREIWHGVQELYRHDIKHGSIAKLATSACAELRIWFHESSRLAIDHPIGILMKNLGNRRVSVASDEPICIGAAVDLKIDEIVAAEQDKRMQTLWMLMSKSDRGVPQQSIFNDRPRIAAEGYRWAPSTLQRRYRDPSDLLGGDGPPDKGVLTARGLRISSAGWELKLFTPPRYVPQNFMPKDDSELLRTYFFVRDAQNVWYGITQHRQLMYGDSRDGYKEDHERPTLCDMLEDQSRDWFVILDKSYWNQGNRALLVWRAAHTSGLPTFRSAMMVLVRKLDPASERLWSAAYLYAIRLRYSWTLRVIQVLCGYENILQWLATFLPGIAVKPVTIMLIKVFKLIGGIIWRLFKKEILSIVKSASTSSQVQTALEETGQDPSNELSMAPFVMHIFMGRHVAIHEEFSQDCEWYVD